MNWNQIGYAVSSSASPPPSPSAARNDPARSRAARGRCTAYATTTTRQASAVSSSISSLMKTWYATSSPSASPLRRHRPGSPSRSTRATISGSRKFDTKLGWPFAWWTMPGAKPRNAPPANAAARDRTRCRDSTQYDVAAVADSAAPR